MASKNRTMAAKNAKLKKWKAKTIKAENAKDMCLWGSVTYFFYYFDLTNITHASIVCRIDDTVEQISWR